MQRYQRCSKCVSIKHILFSSDKGHVFACVCLSVCLSVCLLARLLKMRAWIWMKCCVSTGVGTRTTWLTFEPDPVHSPDAGTVFLSPIAYALQRGNVEFYYVVKIPSTYWYWDPSKQQRVALRRRNTVVGGKCTLPSALLVFNDFE